VEITSESAAPNTVLSTTVEPMAELPCWLFVVAPFPVVAVEGVVLGVAVDVGVGEEIVELAVADANKDVDGGAPLVKPAVAFEERYGGGGTEAEGFFRAPSPHGIFSPVPGWIGFAGGTEVPSAPAIVKRVVQDRIVAVGLVNW